MKRMKTSIGGALACAAVIIGGLVFALLIAKPGDAAKNTFPVHNRSVKKNPTRSEINGLNDQYRQQRLKDKDLNADIAVVTFLRSIAEMNQINSAKAGYYLEKEIGFADPADRAALVAAARSLTTQSDNFQNRAKDVAREHGNSPNESERLLRQIAHDKAKAVKSAEKSLKRALTKEGWLQLNQTIKDRVMPNVTLTRKR